MTEKGSLHEYIWDCGFAGLVKGPLIYYLLFIFILFYFLFVWIPRIP